MDCDDSTNHGVAPVLPIPKKCLVCCLHLAQEGARGLTSRTSVAHTEVGRSELASVRRHRSHLERSSRHDMTWIGLRPLLYVYHPRPVASRSGVPGHGRSPGPSRRCAALRSISAASLPPSRRTPEVAHRQARRGRRFAQHRDVTDLSKARWWGPRDSFRDRRERRATRDLPSPPINLPGQTAGQAVLSTASSGRR
jgi:hypothetical protein